MTGFFLVILGLMLVLLAVRLSVIPRGDFIALVLMGMYRRALEGLMP